MLEFGKLKHYLNRFFGMNRTYWITGLILLLMLFAAMEPAMAQCSMCKVTAESSIEDGKSSIALGLNTGILYLASFPYLLIGILIFLWYRRYKRKQLYDALELNQD